MNYGILPDVYLHLQPQAAYEKPTDGKGHYGFGDTEIGAKWRFIHETDWMPQIAFYPMLELPTGSSARGLGNGKAQVFLPIWLQKAFGEQWTAYGGGGWWFNPGAGNRDWWYAGAVLQRKITGTFAVGAEVQFRGAATVDDRNSWALNGGFIWDLSEKYHLLLSAGHTVSGRSQFQGYAALQITWGPKDGDSAAKK